MDEASPLIVSDHQVQIIKAGDSEEAAGGQTSWFAGCLILANVAMGAGLLSYPHAFYLSGGIIPALIIQLIFITLSQIGMLMIAHCSNISSKGTYPEIIGFFTGKIGLYFTNLFVIVQDFGQCITYLIVIADQIDQVISYSYGNDFCHIWYLNRSFTLPLISLLLIFPFCLLNDINSLRFGSALGVFSVVNIVVLIIYQYFHLPHAENLYNDSHRIADFLKALPIYIYSFQTHIEVTPVYASFKKKQIRELAKSVILQTSICLIVYNLVGTFGFYTFGNEIKSDILANYYPINTFIIITMSVLALKTTTSYPTAFYCPRLVVISILNSFPRVAELPAKPKRIIVVCFMFVITVGMALLFPNIGSVMSLLGAICALLMYFFPGICFVIYHAHERDTYSKLKFFCGLFYAATGTFIAGSVFTQSLTSFVKESSPGMDVLCV